LIKCARSGHKVNRWAGPNNSGPCTGTTAMHNVEGQSYTAFST